MSLPGMIVAAVVAVVLMAVIRFGLAAPNGAKWALAALIPGFLLGGVIDAGLPGPDAGYAVAVALAGYLAGLLLDAVELPDPAPMTTTALIAVGGVSLITGVPFLSGGAAHAIGFWLPCVVAWFFACRRLKAAASLDDRLPLVSLTAAAFGLAWIALIADQTDTASVAAGLAAVLAVGLAAQWSGAGLGVGAAIWLGGGTAFAALGTEMVGQDGTLAPAVTMLLLVLFPPRPESLKYFGGAILIRVTAPLMYLLVAALPILVAVLLAFVASEYTVG